MKKTSILYVEDEPFLGRIVRESLESREFTVHMVSDGKDALPVFLREQPDICVLDIMLPSKDGYAIAKEIRQQKPSVPIIFVTAKTQTEDLIKGFDSGGNDYIRKPFSMEELIVRVNNLLLLTQQKTVPPQTSSRSASMNFTLCATNSTSARISKNSLIANRRCCK